MKLVIKKSNGTIAINGIETKSSINAQQIVENATLSLPKRNLGLYRRGLKVE